jgi:dephospho-CoA kinase
VPTSSSDAFVHRLLAEDEAVHAALRERFGEAVFRADGGVDRAALGRVVFADPEQLAFLEGLLHPRVAEEYAAWLEDLSRRPDPPAVAVSEIPLLFEAGRETAFDRVVVVTAPAELRAGRSKVPRDGRAARLWPDEEKVRRADFAYVNDGTLEELDAFVAGVLEQLDGAA